MSKHGRRFDDAVKRFVSLVKSCLKVDSEEAMLLAIQRRQLTFHCASFSREELHLLDAYDRSKGLPHLKNRAAGYPERISTLLHWRNIHSLLRYCHTRQPTKPLAVKVENIKSLPTFSVSLLSGQRTVQKNPVCETRTVTFSAKKPSAALGAPVPSGSHGSSSAQKASVQKPVSSGSHAEPSISSAGRASMHKSVSSGSHAEPSTSSARKASMQLQKTPNKSSLIMLPEEDTVREFYMDAHCHLDRLFAHEHHTGTLFEYMEKKNRYVCPAFTRCVTVFCDPQFFMFKRERVEDILQEQGIFAAVGCHPCKARKYSFRVRTHILDYMDHPKVLALGETGLDYSQHGLRQSSREEQVYAFKSQVDIAVRINKPLVLHTRNAALECLRILTPLVPDDHPIYLHCFLHPLSEALAWRKKFRNVYFGVTGACTDRNNATVVELIRNLPLHLLILETDAPYFVPDSAPHQIKTSDPLMALQVARRVAEIKHLPLEVVLHWCTKSANQLYRLNALT